MADRLLDVSGSAESAGLAPLLVRRRGTIAAASPISAPGDVGLPLAHLIWNQIRWQGVLSNRTVAAAPAAALLAANVARLAPLVTHRFGLSQTGVAIDTVSPSTGVADAIKVVVCPELDGDYS
jgi:threonine dehydrogenase-like Zn-dependent dehydrogenase